jgi:hypothetical protein
MSRSRPRCGSRSATRGGDEWRAEGDGPALLGALLVAGRDQWLLPACVALSGRKNFANRAENASLLGVHATLAWSVDADAVYPDPFGTCHEARSDDDNACSSRSVRPFGWLCRHNGSAGALAKIGGLSCDADADKSDDDNACSSRSVRPFGWLWRHDGSTGALLKTGPLNCPRSPNVWPPLKYLYESPVNGFMLLSSARATLDAPSAKAVAITNCLFSDCGLRDMACTFKAAAVKRNGPGANDNVRFAQAPLAWTKKLCRRAIEHPRMAVPPFAPGS